MGEGSASMALGASVMRVPLLAAIACPYQHSWHGIPPRKPGLHSTSACASAADPAEPTASTCVSLQLVQTGSHDATPQALHGGP